MTFPVIFQIRSLAIPAHAVFELLGYSIGFQCYRWTRKRQPSQDRLPLETTAWLLAGCVLGAAIGAKCLAWLESWPEYWAVRHNPELWLGAKTIIGGLLGGWIGVEVAKRFLGIRRNTGDAFVLPLAIGIAIGRVGCFLTGLPDHTYGTPTNLPWGVDFGDGIPRHPTQLYESLFSLTCGVIVWLWGRQLPHPPGAMFRMFMLGYLSFRFLVEFIKPTWRPYLGMSALQVASLCGAFVCVWSLRKQRSLG